MKKIKNLLNYNVNDIITLSDLQTQKEFGKLDVDFSIKEVRKYVHPEGIFDYTGYIANYQVDEKTEEQKILLLIRRIENDYDIRVYYLDNDGPSENFIPVFSEEYDDLVDRFEVDLHFDDEDFSVTWDRQGKTVFGVECLVNNVEQSCKTIAEYSTNDETKGNPYCFIEWSGDKTDGYIEIWYGCEVRGNDVEMFHTTKE
jgi:hypothetical protein